MAKLSVNARCFPGGGMRPSVVFLRREPTSDGFALFEFTHELGHASLYGSDTEALRFVEPIITILSAAAFICTVGFDAPWPFLALFYVIHRIRYWWRVRRNVEPEIIADAIGLKSTPGTEDARACVAPLIEHLEKRLAFGSRTGENGAGVSQRLGMLRANLYIHARGRSSIVTHAMAYHPITLIFHFLFILSPVWGRGDPGSLSLILLAVAVPAGLIAVESIRWQDQLQAEFDRQLGLRGGTGDQP